MKRKQKNLMERRRRESKGMRKVKKMKNTKVLNALLKQMEAEHF